MSNIEKQIIDGVVSLENQLSAEQRKKVYSAAKIAVPVIGIVGAVLPFLIGGITDARVTAIIVGVVAVLSGVVHAVADDHTDPALYAPSLALHPDLAVQDTEATEPGVPTLPLDGSTPPTP